MDKHTQTPWDYGPKDDDGGFPIYDETGCYVVADADTEELARLIVSAMNERSALLKVEEALREMVQAARNGHIDSEDMPGDPDSGIMPYKWHEEWAHHAKAALSQLEEVRHGK